MKCGRFCYVNHNIPPLSNVIGRPANILVKSRDTKYPTRVGKDTPRIDNAFDGRSTISDSEIHKEPAVTEI